MNCKNQARCNQNLTDKTHLFSMVNNERKICLWLPIQAIALNWLTTVGVMLSAPIIYKLWKQIQSATKWWLRHSTQKSQMRLVLWKLGPLQQSEWPPSPTASPQTLQFISKWPPQVETSNLVDVKWSMESKMSINRLSSLQCRIKLASLISLSQMWIKKEFRMLLIKKMLDWQCTEQIINF